eukprot:scaffold188674_cov45-Attheya_sp.AAC.3
MPRLKIRSAIIAQPARRGPMAMDRPRLIFALFLVVASGPPSRPRCVVRFLKFLDFTPHASPFMMMVVMPLAGIILPSHC